MAELALKAVADQRRKAAPLLSARLERISLDLIRAHHYSLGTVIAGALDSLGEALAVDQALIATGDETGPLRHHLWERSRVNGSAQGEGADALSSSLWRMRSRRTLVCSDRGRLPASSRHKLPAGLSSAIVVPLHGRATRGMVAIAARTARSWAAEEVAAVESLAAMVAAALDRVASVASLDVEKDRRLRAEAETRRLRDQLAHAGRISMLGELAASLAHELKQPLSAIYMNAQAAERFLDRKPPELENVSGALRDLNQDCRRAADVIGRVREMFRPHETEGVEVSVGLLIEHVLRLLHEDAVTRDVNVAIDVRPDLPPIRGDRVQLEQVVMNLLVNAFDAVTGLADARDVTVRASRRRGFVEVAVLDTGRGIATGDLGRVFEPLFTRKPQGMGMGLAICRTIVEAHGGTISASNRAEGGSMFAVRLPALGTAAGGAQGRR